MSEQYNLAMQGIGQLQQILDSKNQEIARLKAVVDDLESRYAGKAVSAMTQQRNELQDRIIALEAAIREIIEGKEDNEFIENWKCTQPTHDDRWCGYCEDVKDGMDVFQERIVSRLKSLEKK